MLSILNIRVFYKTQLVLKVIILLNSSLGTFNQRIGCWKGRLRWDLDPGEVSESLAISFTRGGDLICEGFDGSTPS